MLLITGCIVLGMWVVGGALLLYMARFEFELIVGSFPKSTFAFYYGGGTAETPFRIRCSQVVRYAGVVACPRRYIAKGLLEYQEWIALPRSTRRRMGACTWLLLCASTGTLFVAWLMLG